MKAKLWLQHPRNQACRFRRKFKVWLMRRWWKLNLRNYLKYNEDLLYWSAFQCLGPSINQKLVVLDGTQLHVSRKSWSICRKTAVSSAWRVTTLTGWRLCPGVSRQMKCTTSPRRRYLRRGGRGVGWIREVWNKGRDDSLRTWFEKYGVR